MILPVIISGGSGSRLWPLSTTHFPKQFLPLLSEETLFQETVKRLVGLRDVADPLVVCNKVHQSTVVKQLQQINMRASRVILEPIGRNTAPAITIAALQAVEAFMDPILLILPSDHAITKPKDFQQIIYDALTLAEYGKLLTFGIVPTYPETGYGYIKVGSSLKETKSYKVENFVEKPNLELAKSYLESGKYYWNSGIFMFKASVLLAEMEKYRPDILHACQTVFNNITRESNYFHLDDTKFAQCPSDSIDYSVMEKTSNAVVIPMNAGWSDIGSWAALAKISKADIDGNIKLGNVITKKVTNSYLRAESRQLVIIGVEDLVVVETKDTVLVVHKNHCQNVKLLADQLIN